MDHYTADADVFRTESCTLATVRRVAAMLDLDPDGMTEGAPLPRGWQFTLMAADTRRRELRADGFPGLGVPMPELGLPRLMLGGRTVDFLGDIPVGAAVKRRSGIRKLVEKANASGPMAIVTIGHELSVGDTPVLVENQTYLMLSGLGAKRQPGPATALPEATASKTIVPDDTLLFQYSALGFNSHRIHIDKAYARDVERFPELVVNGGLATLLLTEFMRQELGVVPQRFTTRHLAPLFCGRALTMTAEHEGPAWRLKTFDDNGVLAVEMDVETQEQ